ncbi:histidine phosphatase family protein [Streptomyces albidus (ex Kaewkla and Franco 2022)]|uniref:histidine phosphatase family protein n=1 Tax=Streptomyces albidus (ex Kaewkla and Franco 2022) TaxID=722709 RepID=UPI0015EF52F8|nr:histidine phosphatase family protein [Streptomyces albidus (ex Kaewkla and Franco 2022)]
MTTRVTLISPARNDASDGIRFDAGNSLSDAGLRAARAAAGSLPIAGSNLVSPSARCAETAEALGLEAVTTADQAAGCDMGRWRGRSLEEVTADEPEGVGLWLSDAASAPHGGESVRQLCARIEAWLAQLAAQQGRVVAVVEPDVVRAAVVCALGAPARSLWRADVEPLTATELSGRSARWNLRTGTRLGPR